MKKILVLLYRNLQTPGLCKVYRALGSVNSFTARRRRATMFVLIIIGLGIFEEAFAAKVGVVVKFSEGNVVEKCLDVSEPSNGYQAMQSSNLNLIWKDYGALGYAMCKIEDTGCPESDCFCSSNYWNFLYKKPGESWAYSQVGLGGYNVEAQDVLGLAWDTFKSPDEVFSPDVSFDEICSSVSSGLALPPSAFSSPRPPTPSPENAKGEFGLLINGGGEYTRSRKLTLNLEGGPDAVRMIIAEDPEFEGAVGQIQYSSQKEWILSKGEGKKTIYVKFYNQWGRSSNVVSDSIILREKPFPEMAASLGEQSIPELKEKVAALKAQIVEILKKRISELSKRINLLQSQLKANY